MEVKKVKELFVSIDIEKKGSGFQHPILQIGVAFGTSLDEPIQTASFCFDDPGPWEQRCYDEFWSKNLSTLERIQKEAKDPKTTWEAYQTFHDNFENLSNKVTLVCDNPAYDVAHIDFQLYNRFNQRLGIRFTKAGKYRSISDPSEQIKGLPDVVAEQITTKLNKEYPHTHWAPDDARHNLAMHFMVQNAIATLKSTDLYYSQ